MRKSTLLLVTFILSIATNQIVLAGDCPVGSPFKDKSGKTISYEEKFGPGTEALMDCVKKRDDIKLVMQVNKTADKKGRPYGFRSFTPMINLYTVTHGIPKEELDIVAIVHGGGYKLILDPDAKSPHKDATANKFKQHVQKAMKDGIKVYFCLETAASKNVKIDQIIPGVKLVPGGLVAIRDLQKQGYDYVQP